jgi:SAM-dependent methyltransferase
VSDTLVKMLGWRATVLQGDITVTDRWQWLRRHLEPGPVRTLDAGCGTGAFTMYAAMQGNQAVGVAFDSEQLNRAERRAAMVGLGPDQIRFVVGDLRQLHEFGESLGQFDQVLLFETIEHILDDQKLLRDVADRLRPGGRLLLTAPTKEHPPLWGEVLSEVEDGGHVRWGYTRQEMEALFPEAGLEVLATDFISGLVSQKIASLTFGLRRLDDRIAWAATLPLRAFRPLDRPLTSLFRYPHLSIGIVGQKKS